MQQPLLTFVMVSAVTSGLLWILIRHHTVGVLLVMAVHAWGAVAGQSSALVLGIHVYPADALSLCAAGVGLGRLLVHGVPRRAGLGPLLGLGALTLCSTLRGIGTFGLQSAVNDVRMSSWYLLAAALYTATMPAGVLLERAVRRAWGATAVAYAGLCLIGWARHGLHAVTYRATANGAVIDPRPVSAAAALVLAQAAVLLLYAPAEQKERTEAVVIPGRLRRATPALVLLLFVVLLQHRTIWVVTVAMVMVAFVLSTVTHKRGSLPAAVAVLSVALVVVIYQLGSFGTIGNALATSFEEVRRSNSTLEWRVAGWQELLPRSPAEWLSGVPFGSGYDRVVGGGLVTVGPHNYYVHLLLRLGLFSLVLLIGWYVLTWRRLSSKDPWDLTLRALMVGQLVFFVTYSASPEQGVLLGLCMWYLRTRAACATSGSGSYGVPPIPLPKSAGRPAGSALAAPTARGASR